jgi:hypothetical protein
VPGAGWCPLVALHVRSDISQRPEVDARTYKNQNAVADL